jgi:hypothetical protein
MRNVSILILFTLISVTSFGQIPNKNQIFPSENISFSIDRNIYLPGEIIWLAASIQVNEQISTSLSTVLYVELFNEQLKPVLRQKMDIENGKTFGSIVIPVDLISGYYFIRVYTMYLRNFDAKFYPVRKITIINPELPLNRVQTNDTIQIETKNDKLLCDFPNIIALHLNPQFYNKVEKIEIVNVSNLLAGVFPKPIQGFTSTSFVPDFESEYKLILKFKSGDSVIKKLPVCDTLSFYSSIQSINNEYVFQFKNLPESSQNYHLSLINECHVRIFSQELSDAKDAVIKIPSQTILPENCFLVLKNYNGQIIHAELINPEPDIENELKIATTKKIYHPREKVIVQIVPSDYYKDSLKVLVSVIKKGTGNSDLINNNLTSNYITIDSATELSRSAKTAFLIFNNQRFKNKDFRQQFFSYPEKSIRWLPETRDLTISGLVRYKNTSEPAHNILVFASVVDEQPQLHINKTGIDGSFVFNLPNLNDAKNIYLSLRTPIADQLEIFLNNDFSNDFAPVEVLELRIDTTMQLLLSEMFTNRQISKVYPQFPVTTQLNKYNDFHLFGKPDYTVVLDDYIDLDSFEEVFREIIPFVKLKKTKTQHYFEVLDTKRGIIYDDPLVMLDEIPVFDINSLLKINPKSIDKIEVIVNPYVYGDQTFNGIIFIRTNTKNFGSITLPNSSVFVEYQTIIPQTNFKYRDFSSSDDSSVRIPDYRTTLYWNPIFLIDPRGSIIEFSASDHESAYELIITKLTNTGPMIIGRSSFEVKKQ